MIKGVISKNSKNSKVSKSKMLKSKAPKKISGGTVHKLPSDLKKSLVSASWATTSGASVTALKTWESLTPLARNEWICWVVTVKTPETREKHLKRAIEDLAKGKRRPCCWMGCIHRTDKKVSQSVQWVLSRGDSKRASNKVLKKVGLKRGSKKRK